MLQTAIIVFREVFEIVLIVGIIMAATRGVPSRWKALGIGFLGGIIGSLILSVFTGSISDLADGMGQEYFNAFILFIAAGFIGWTLIWMKRHAREMKAHFKRVGDAVTEGRLPYISLSIIIALAILREGTEISLFLYGQYFAQNATIPELTLGALIGGCGGAIIGALIYFGLVRFSTKFFFRITSWLLTFLVAGMVSQGFGLLSAAGAFESLSFTLWDSSWFLEDRGFTGKAMEALIGYTARPSAIQIIGFLSTLMLLTAALKFSEYRPLKSASTHHIVK